MARCPGDVDKIPLCDMCVVEAKISIRHDCQISPTSAINFLENLKFVKPGHLLSKTSNQACTRLATFIQLIHQAINFMGPNYMWYVLDVE